jgi:tetratricopeptide (TPR) repeat protein
MHISTRLKNRVFVKMMILSVLVLWMISCITSVKDEKIPVSTESENARLLYLRADTLFEKVYISEAVALLEDALAEDPVNILNTLGYTYMAMEQFEEAAKALDKYIELKPDDPNPYDSKGDYYMAVEEYGKAYESFMKAVKIDSTWTGSLQKANRARAMIKTDIEE